MAQQIQEIMTKQVHCVRKETPVSDVARMMRDRKIGDVLVTHSDGTLCGIVTDRDIVVRGIAEGRALDQLTVGDICSTEITKVSPNASIEETVRVMRERSIRRVPVVHDGTPIGIVSIGDLARHQDPRSALAEISSAAPNN